MYMVGLSRVHIESNEHHTVLTFLIIFNWNFPFLVCVWLHCNLDFIARNVRATGRGFVACSVGVVMFMPTLNLPFSLSFRFC